MLDNANRNQETGKTRDAALWYAKECGFHVFPVSREKTPLISDWNHAATKSSDLIESWWSKWPDACIGVACGPSKILSLDLDTYKPGGAESAKRIKSYLELVEPDIWTGRGGEQFFFRSDDETLRNVQGGLVLDGVKLEAVDIRSNGGFCIVPPSRSAHGLYVRVATESHFKSLPPVPSKLVTLLREYKERRTTPKTDKPRESNETWGMVMREVVERNVFDLKFAGGWSDRGTIALHCPLPGHDDKNPSAFIAVSEGNGSFHCSACGENAGVLGLGIRLGFGTTNAEVTAYLKKSGISLPQATEQQHARLTTPFNPENFLLHDTELAEEPTEWLWEPYIPLGEWTFVKGEDGTRKTWFVMDLLSRATRGGPFPYCSESREPVCVFYMTGDDSLSKTIRGRFRTLGGVRERIYYPVADKRTRRNLTLAEIDIFEALLEKYRPGIIAFDPLAAFTNVNMNDAGEVRNAMGKFRYLLDKFKPVIIATQHHNKNEKAEDRNRGAGSYELRALARSVFTLVLDPADKGTTLVTHEKHTLSSAGKGASFSFEVKGGKMVYGDTFDKSADDLYREKSESRRESPKTDAVVEFIQGTLEKNGGWCWAREVFAECERIGVSEKVAYMAQDRLGLRHRRAGLGGSVRWFLPGRESAQPDLAG